MEIKIDNVTGEAFFGGKWYASYREATLKREEYEQERALYLENEYDRMRDEGEGI